MQSIEDLELLLCDIFHHPGLYQEFVTPVNEAATQTLPFRDWFAEDHFGRVRLYQIPALPWDHLLPSDVPPDKAWVAGYTGIDRSDMGTAWVKGGRSTSKSWDLIHDALQTAQVRKGEETLVTSRDDNHLTKRLDSIWVYITQHPLFVLLVRGKPKQGEPYARIDWQNDHVTKGIFESTTGDGENYLGEKFHRKLVDEFQLTGSKAWKNLHDATSEIGCVYRTTGVSDGRRDTPAHRIRNDPEEADRVHIRPQYLSENWTPKRKQDAIKEYGGTDTQEYIQNVDAGEGEEVSLVWNIRDILRCMRVPKEDRKKQLDKRNYLKCPILEITGEDVKNEGIPSGVRFPPAMNLEWPIWIPTDIGHKVHPTVAGVFGMEPLADDEFKVHHWGNVVMLGVDYDNQAEILLAMCKHYNAEAAGVDYTGADGVSVIQSWNKLDDHYREQVWMVLWDARIPLEVNDKKQGRRRRKKVEGQKKVDKKHFITLRVMTRFRSQNAELSYDPAAMLEFGSEVKKASTGRFSTKEVIYSGPQGDHRIDMWRILEYMIYQYPTREGQTKVGKSLWDSKGLVGLGRI